ncbi:MAG: hypothetical protein QM675_03920 [Protaetiibacter sp.]
MPTEAELRELLRDGGTPGPLDAELIIRRARARRRPKRIAAGALGALAVAGIAVPVALGLGLGSGGSMSASDSADTSALESGDAGPLEATGGDGADAPTVPLPAPCGAESPTDLASTLLSLLPITADAASTQVEATATITDDALPDTAAIASLSTFLLVRDGVVHGYAIPADGTGTIRIAPAASVEVTLSLELLACPVGDAQQRATFPSGSYRIVAAGTLRGENGGSAVAVDGVAGELTIR